MSEKQSAENDAPRGPEERAIHAKYQSDDPAADYYDPAPIPPAKG